MKNLIAFKSFQLSGECQKRIKGGNVCTDCVHSAFIACAASCGTNSQYCDYNSCVNSQTNQCLAMFC